MRIFLSYLEIETKKDDCFFCTSCLRVPVRRYVDTSQNNLTTNGWGRATPALGVVMIVTVIGIARGN